MKTKTILSILCLLSAYCLLGTVYCFSAVPSLINYQGVLKDSTGVPYNGNATMVFSIWDDVVMGTKMWDETQAIVSVSHGLFNVLLGSSVPIPHSVFAHPNSWLQVIANGSQLSPRRQIVSVAYAYRAADADTAEYARNAPVVPDDDWVIDGDNIYHEQGNVGIGTTSPEATLQVSGTMKVLGVWETKAVSTVYQAATDGFVVGSANANVLVVKGYTDSNNPPTTIRFDCSGWLYPHLVSFCMPVRKGDYWKITAGGTDLTITGPFWIPLGI